MPESASAPQPWTRTVQDEQVSRRQLAVKSLRNPLTRALLVLTLTSGLVDAVTYLGLGKVFAANMTGNIVLLGFGVAGGADLPVVSPIVALGAFLIGAGGGGVLARRLSDRHSRHIAVALGAEVGLLALAAAIALAVDIKPDHLSADVIIAVLALSMGLRNATVRGLAVPDLTTTVITLTVTGLAAESPLFGGSGKGSLRRILAISSMFVGAVIGALLLKTHLALPLVAAAGLALVTWLIYIPAAKAEHLRFIGEQRE